VDSADFAAMGQETPGEGPGAGRRRAGGGARDSVEDGKRTRGYTQGESSGERRSEENHEGDLGNENAMVGSGNPIRPILGRNNTLKRTEPHERWLQSRRRFYDSATSS